MQFYQRLRDLREDADKSQKEIADLLKTSQSYYAQYENGKRSLPFERAMKLARYYNVSLDYIAGFIDTPRKLN
jgi:transcriptional regulator with XRE-family HTH domain